MAATADTSGAGSNPAGDEVDPGDVGFEPYTGEVYGWAYRVLGRHHDALDVVQDVFVRWARQCTRRVPQYPRGWLRRVTLNRAIDLRRNHRWNENPLGAAGRDTTAPNNRDGDGARIDQALLREDIALALDGLSGIQRGVLVAKVYDDMTFAQIAEELAVAVSTVKTHYLRAVRAVRDRLQPRWSREDES